MTHRRRCTAVVAAAVLLVLSGCGVEDRLTRSAEADRLRDEVRQIVSDAQARAATRVDLSPDVVLGALVSQVPPEPTGYQLDATVLPATNQAQVVFALQGKIDGIGPGQGTQILRLCVSVTMTATPDLRSTVEDGDCSALPTRPDVEVSYDG